MRRGDKVLKKNIQKRAPTQRGHMKERHTPEQGKAFWNREYKEGDHFSLSDKPASELVKFMRWMRKEQDHIDLSELTFLDIGCGNGRNGMYLAEEFGMTGSGFDLASSAIENATAIAKQKSLPVRLYVHSLSGATIPEEDNSCDIVIDSMVSHCLQKEERENYKKELLRVLRPGGFVFIKTFLREGDEHAKRMIREHPGPDSGSYIHPVIGIYEYTWTESNFVDFWGEEFSIQLLHKSHGYQRWGGQPYRRRYMVAYLQKPDQ